MTDVQKTLNPALMAFEIGHSAYLATKMLDDYELEDNVPQTDSNLDPLILLYLQHPELKEKVKEAIEKLVDLYQSAMTIEFKQDG